ncbi:MAG: glycosyltransferase family 4 protein [Clostridia bacterium]|nr:glycosyltransferase family 4 protein [Clostridia bacterium]
MQILILANHSGGLYDFRKDLIAELKKQASVTVAVPRNDRWEELQLLADRVIELPVDRRGMNPVRDAKLFRRYRKMLRAVMPDLVLTYTVKPNVYGGLACRMAHVPYVVNITGLGSALENGGLLRKFVLALYRPALAGAKTVFFENAGNRDDLVATGVVPQGRDAVLHGAGVNLDDFPCAAYPQDAPLRFLFVGRVMHEKGVDELFYAAKQMKQEYGDGVEFHFVGSFEESYKPLMDELEQSGIVKYHGYQSDMRPFYAMSGCVVLPSYHEGMSNVLLEAASSGRPLITSAIPGCLEAVEDGVSGYLCESRNAEALLISLRRFAQLTPEERRDMGLAGRRRMEALFDKKAVVARTVEYINR